MKKEIPSDCAEWIQYKLDSYKEKPRKGTPKGQPYGISKHKYHAALLHLLHNKKTFSLQKIANEVGVSYSQIANWRTQDRFKSLVQDLFTEHIKIILPIILSRIESGELKIEKSYNDPAYRLLCDLRDIFILNKKPGSTGIRGPWNEPRGR